VFVDRAEGVEPAAFERWHREEMLPTLLSGTSARLVVAADPLPLLIDAPGDVPRSEADDRRQLTLWFLDSDPSEDWERTVLAYRKALETSGTGNVVTALAFIPTIPGTDTYTDRLWARTTDQGPQG